MIPRRDVSVHHAPDALVSLIRQAVVRTLDTEGARDAEISVTLLDDAAIQAMNRTYLSKDRPTDVVAFSLGEEGEVLGDIYIGADQASRQAKSWGVGFDEEVVRLVIHGTLHVLGHDHPDGSDREASAMYRLQERLVGEVMGSS
ncbi:MAG: rRNA maturation RNase YbeY [Gemmatimonadetes bacterium]|nr:rRNA maturation RNase YbeY [Gemmatimonadota bacterium]